MPAKAPLITKKQERTLRVLGQRIRDRREELNLSATVVAEAAEISRVTLYRIEKGEPSVAMGAYLSAISALGLTIDLSDSAVKTRSGSNAKSKLPKKIPIANYQQLKRLAWQMKSTAELTPEEALDLYERNWRHVDIKNMSEKEKEFITTLLNAFGREKLLV
jgi:transcriptional regulator with XRE-family HTH domain